MSPIVALAIFALIVWVPMFFFGLLGFPDLAERDLRALIFWRLIQLFPVPIVIGLVWRNMVRGDPRRMCWADRFLVCWMAGAFCAGLVMIVLA